MHYSNGPMGSHDDRTAMRTQQHAQHHQGLAYGQPPTPPPSSTLPRGQMSLPDMAPPLNFSNTHHPRQSIPPILPPYNPYSNKRFSDYAPGHPLTPPAATPHQSSFYSTHPQNPSPTGSMPASSANMHRGLTSLSSPGLYQPPMAYGHQQQQHRGSTGSLNGAYGYNGPLSGPMLANLHQPGPPLHVMGQVMYHHPNGSLYVPNAHPQAHHPHQERPFKCDECPQGFNRNHDLKRHKKIHMAVKPFPCGACDKSFSRKDALKVCLPLPQCSEDLD